MKPLLLATGLLRLADAAPSPPSLRDGRAGVATIPTRYESAIMGRRILAMTKLATFSTVFPDLPPNEEAAGHDEAHGAGHGPRGLGGVPIGLMDYVADCEEKGDPTILAIEIGTSFQNVEHGSNMSVSARWLPPFPPKKRISLFSYLSDLVADAFGVDGWRSDQPDPVPYSAANLPRFSLLGYLERMEVDERKSDELAACYVGKHPDARHWLPGNLIHRSNWARLVVTEVYWVGGFGDRAYIGWIPAEEWKNVTREQWQAIRLPGEKEGWDEWSIDQGGDL